MKLKSSMGLHLCLHDNKELRAKIREKAEDIFEAKSARPQLRVFKFFKAGTGEQKDVAYAPNVEDVKSALHIETLLCVRGHLHSVSILVFI